MSPIVDQFLASISQLLKDKNSTELKVYLQVEPPVPEIYFQLKEELIKHYQDGDILDKHIEELVLEAEDGTEDGGLWPGCQALLKVYLEFWRDVDFEDLLKTHEQLSTLVK